MGDFITVRSLQHFGGDLRNRQEKSELQQSDLEEMKASPVQHGDRAASWGFSMTMMQL